MPDTISSVADLIELEESLEGSTQWAFRGQPRDFGNLKPSFQRQFPRQSVGTAELIEARLIEAFREHYVKLNDRTYDMPDPNRLGPGYDLRCLSVMQHYEIPTRLLDWTSSLWTAVYFACASEPSEAAELWIYNRRIFEHQRVTQPPLQNLVSTAPAIGQEPDFLGWRGQGLLVEVDIQITPRMKQQTAHHTVSTEVFADHALLFDGLPQPSIAEITRMALRDDTKALRRIVIGAACKAKALQFLAEHKNVTASTIFPDVVGLGRFLRWQLESLRTMML